MNKRPLIFTISLVFVIIAMFSIILYQNNNAPVKLAPEREGGIIFGGAAPPKSESLNSNNFTPAPASTSTSDASCD